jgi:PAS domain S-box-containing protein
VHHLQEGTMSQTGAPLVGSYDLRLVALSIFIALSASSAALDLGGRVTAARGWIRSAWLAGGAAAMGFGIWSMHFTGMLAFHLPVPVAYHWPTVLLSLLSAIFASAAALYVVSRKKMGRVEALTGSVVMGLGIAGMHYIGMAAMRLPAVCHYRPSLVALSIMIAILASLAALVLAFGYRDDFRGTTWAKVIGAAVMGAAISLMHYTGMMSASFIPSSVFPDVSRAVSISSLGLGGIVMGTLVVQGVAILTSAADRRFAMQAQELQTSERFRQIADILRDVLLLSNADLSEVLFVNRAYEVIWGRTAESLYAAPRSWLEGVHPDDRQQVQEAVQRLVSGEPLDYLECRVVRTDGSISWVRLRAYPIVDAQGHCYRIVGTAHEFTKRKQAEEAVRRLSGRLLRLQDDERRRIARDLHDSTGQNFVVLAMMLDQLRGSIPSGKRKSRRLLSECQALADRCVHEVRTLSYVLHPPMLDEAGLEDAIRDYVNGFTKRSGIQVGLELPAGLGRMTREVELALFRVVQEALTNIQRHSGSQQAKIRIDRNSHLTLEISDHGRQASASAPQGKQEPPFQVGVGIPSMQERVKLIGGRLDVHFSSHGSTVRVTIPLERNEREKVAHSGG